ncbi:MAG: hypothetical protein ACRCXL_13205 [Dermatophilaceae bacterium]
MEQPQYAVQQGPYAVQHGQSQHDQQRGPRTWVVVALTLGVVVVVILAFVGGLVTGIAMSDTAGPGTGVPGAGPPGQAPGAPAPGAPAPDGAPGGATPQGGGAVDSCVVGTWRTVEHSESADTKDGKVTMTGIDRTVKIAADGTETVTYGSKPATVTTEQGAGTAIYAGTVVYDITAQSGTMSFSLRSASGTLTVTTENSKPQQQELKPGTGSVRYTCTADRLTQEATGFRAVLQRAS